jgi:hypothetical protein
MCTMASELSWHATQAVATGEFIKVVGTASTLVPGAMA